MRGALIFLPFLVIACQPSPKESATQNQTPEAKMIAASFNNGQNFNEYWNSSSQAEINSYSLSQESFGELHRGEVVLVFLPETLSRSKQVRLENPEGTNVDKIQVMKSNMMRRFTTGLSDNSLMSSILTPIDFLKDPHSIKMTTSLQDWSGQVFHQLAWHSKSYDVSSISQLGTNEDIDYSVTTTMLEDELWNRIRIDPSSIETRSTTMLPSLAYLSMKHKPIRPVDAGIINSQIDERLSQVEVVYPTIQRVLRIKYETKFPHKIVGWEEQNGKEPLSRATLKTTVMSPFWSENKVADRPLRDKLGLMF